MTQARSSQSLHLSLTPMQLPEAASAIEAVGQSRQMQSFSSSVDTQKGPSCELLLHPREASEMIVQLENRGSRPLLVNLQLESDFPAEWYRIGMEGHEIAPGQRMDAVIYFQAPEFFEDSAALAVGESLKLDYRSRLCVYYTEQGTNRQLVETADFNLYIRPRSLYLNFLPALYGEVDFIGRFLKIFEQAFEPVVQAMDSMWAHLDPMMAPEALLPFLAHWVAWPMDSRWSVTQQRYLIARAVELYRWRGTKRGLRLYLHLYTNLPLDEHLPQEADKHICIEEVFGRGFILGETHLGSESIIGGGRPYHFIVRLRPNQPGTIDEHLVRTIINQEKPAFCTYELYIENING